MTLRMADAILPGNLPTGFDAYAGYDDGNWPDFQAVAAAHGSAHLLELTVFLANRGEGIDDEPGDASDADTVTYVAERLAAGEWRPVVYASITRMANIVALQTAASHERASYRLLSAHYGAGTHICGPTTCKLGPQCDGTQWIDHGPWDESLLADDFFEPAPLTTPEVPPMAVSKARQFNGEDCYTQIVNGHLYLCIKTFGYFDIAENAGLPCGDFAGEPKVETFPVGSISPNELVVTAERSNGQSLAFSIVAGAAKFGAWEPSLV